MQSFRRLRVTVRGPDGFARDVALEAAGAGTYSATVPLARPGAYIAVARDEISGKPVATTGAALTAGEELRPTGSDSALLSRIADLTGGKKRDTLAGIFSDRAARRFAYRDITAQLLLVAAFALLLAVAARRLSIPEGAYQWLGRAVRWRPWARRPEGPPAPGGASAQATLESLMKSKQETAEQRRQPVAAPNMPAPGQVPVSAAPAAWRAPPTPAAGSSPAGTTRQPRAATAPVTRAGRRPAQPSPAGAQGGGPPSSRPLTAAEILLQRRKGRRG